MFELTKWYIDVVDPSGRSAIAYWAFLRWGALALGWEGLSLHHPGRPPLHRSGPAGKRGPVAIPATSDLPLGEIDWQSDASGCHLTCRPWFTGFRRCLLESAEGLIDWSCEAPAATVSLRLVEGEGRLELEGTGYVERMRLTLPPWKAPISELRWGRWATTTAVDGRPVARSVVWIDWRGSRPLTLVLVDGRPVAQARVEDDCVVAETTSLALRSTRTLHSRSLAEALDAVPLLLRALPASWHGLEDRKSLSLGVSDEAQGWAIHEVVRFP